MEEEEREDYYIKETDSLIVAGKVVTYNVECRTKSMPVSKSMSMSRNTTISMSITKL